MDQRSLRCHACGHEPSPAEFLSGIRVWWPWLDVAQHVCPRCDAREEIQLEPGRVVFGYLYAAGTAHYAGMDQAPLPGLVVDRRPHGLRLTLGEAGLEVPAGVRASDRRR